MEIGSGSWVLTFLVLELFAVFYHQIPNMLICPLIDQLLKKSLAQ